MRKKIRMMYFPLVIRQLFLQASVMLVSSSSIMTGMAKIQRRKKYKATYCSA